MKQHHFGANDPLIRRALRQFERELMLLESSDWPFILHTGTQIGYAKNRLAEHIKACLDLKQMLGSHNVDEKRLTELEWKHNCFSESDLGIV
jgi:1,4-alpha-glucan branching enzyme